MKKITDPTGSSAGAASTWLRNAGVCLLAGAALASPLGANAAETNIAKNVSRSGFPSPLGSDHGWGGGSDPWETVDGARDYPEWYHGLAFTGGHTDVNNPNSAGYLEPAGVRQATIDFGEPKAFGKIVLWHHGDEHVPATTHLDRWDGAAWLSIPFQRSYDSNYVSTGAGAKPDTYTFPEVTASKVRYSFDNREQNILGTWIIHGWLYEIEVFAGAPPTSDLSITQTVTPNPVTVGSSATVILTISNAGPDTATGVKIAGTLGPNLEWISTSPGSNFQINGTGAFSQTVGSLAPSNTTTVTLNVRARCEGTATNSVIVTADQPDPNPADNTLPSFVVSIDPPYVNYALNPSGAGFPSPLESDRGWGGGSYPWHLVDGLHSYPAWYNGLAFTGGHTDSSDPNSPGYVEPAGPRQATINFGATRTFEKVTLWHHGDEHAPASVKLEYWNGSVWSNLPFTRFYRRNYEPGQFSGSAYSDEYYFAPVSGSKVRYNFDNREQNMAGTWLVHGWLYEFEVFGRTGSLAPVTIETAPITAAPGQVAHLAWQSTCAQDTIWTLKLVRGGAITASLIVTVVSDGNGHWHADWTVPCDLPAGQDYSLRVEDAATGQGATSATFILGLKLDMRMALTWPDGPCAADFVVEEADSPAGPWRQLAAPQVVVDGQRVVIIPMSGKGKLHRLWRP